MKINLYLVYNDFGNTLPDKSTFFNDPRNEVTRAVLRRYYHNKGATDYRRYRWFKEEFEAFATALEESKDRVEAENKEVAKDAVK